MDFYNKGIYTYNDASRLLGQSKAVIRGLVNGYKYKNKPQKPVISKKTVIYEDKEYLTFYDIIELKFINYFLACGVKRKTIVDAYEKAKKELNKDYPFATHFTTDGTYIYADNKFVFLGLHNDQVDFRSICLPTMMKGIEFENDIPVKWRPFEKEIPEVALNPLFKYGQPMIEQYHILTKTLYDAYIAENKNFKTVSEWFNIPLNFVQQAVAFEERLG